MLDLDDKQFSDELVHFVASTENSLCFYVHDDTGGKYAVCISRTYKHTVPQYNIRIHKDDGRFVDEQFTCEGMLTEVDGWQSKRALDFTNLIF